MREIKFRGKRKNGEWVYGNLLQGGRRAFIHISGQPLTSTHIFEVDTKTVGQMLPITDKDNNPIFEGDILETEYKNIVKVGFHNFRMCLIAISADLRSRCHHFDFVDILTDTDENGHWTGATLATIIGNVFDTPELLDKAS